MQTHEAALAVEEMNRKLSSANRVSTIYSMEPTMRTRRVIDGVTMEYVTYLRDLDGDTYLVLQKEMTTETVTILYAACTNEFNSFIRAWRSSVDVYTAFYEHARAEGWLY